MIYLIHSHGAYKLYNDVTATTSKFSSPLTLTATLTPVVVDITNISELLSILNLPTEAVIAKSISLTAMGNDYPELLL